MTEAGAAPAVSTPGASLGVIGLVFDFVFAPLGLTFSILGKVQSNRAGVKNGIATVGIVLGIVFTIGGVFLAVVLGSLVIGGVGECAKLGNGTHVVGNTTYTCTPGRSVVSTGSN
jgi:hypothetical protein